MKIIINGDALKYDFDLAHVPMSQALAIERAAGRRYAEWETEFLRGSAEALAVIASLALSAGGHDVPLQDILDGKFELNFSETYSSAMASLAEQQRARAAAENPTSGAAPLTAPDGTPTTSAGTKPSSPKSST